MTVAHLYTKIYKFSIYIIISFPIIYCPAVKSEEESKLFVSFFSFSFVFICKLRCDGVICISRKMSPTSLQFIIYYISTVYIYIYIYIY